MKRKYKLLVIITACLVSITNTLSDHTYAAQERRTALVIGNSSYSSGPLKNPVNDAADMAESLQKLGFSVTLKKNASYKEMDDAIRDFGDKLKKGGVGLFFYAGHGVQIRGRNYLIPIGANISKDTDVKFFAVDTEIVLAEMGNAGNQLNIVILDACRDNPFVKSFRSVNRGLAIISNAPKGTFITYSTSPGKVAIDGSGRNSPYTESLIRHMKTPGLPIEEVFKEVRKDLVRKTSGHQVPWELSSLEGRFYFIPGQPSISATSSAAEDLDVELRKIDAEKERLRRERELLEQQAVLAKEKKLLDEKRKKLVMGSQPSGSNANEIGTDGRFIAYDNGTVLDTKTNLMWAAIDNMNDISWRKARSYCINYNAGGYNDWRMPTIGELQTLYDGILTDRKISPDCWYDKKMRICTNLIKLTGVIWADETRDDYHYLFSFWRCTGPFRKRHSEYYNDEIRALPVRTHDSHQ